MKVAILSDSHDSIPNLKKAIETALRKDAEVLFHCGDLISPFMIPVLANFGKETHLILGNNRGDIFLMMQHLKKYPHINFHGEQAFLEVKGFKVAMVHYPKIAYALAQTQEYDFVFCGHTHVYEVKEVGKTLVLNPGEILGKEGTPTFAILDLESKKVEKVLLE
ncbi:MAG: metallophosphoesterase [Thermodesulfobacteria bacterium]|nr:metallophosphoesterase [Thermodesulfobacteriota bacterium]